MKRKEKKKSIDLNNKINIILDQDCTKTQSLGMMLWACWPLCLESDSTD